MIWFASLDYLDRKYSPEHMKKHFSQFKASGPVMARLAFQSLHSMEDWSDIFDIYNWDMFFFGINDNNYYNFVQMKALYAMTATQYFWQWLELQKCLRLFYFGFAVVAIAAFVWSFNHFGRLYLGIFMPKNKI